MADLKATQVFRRNLNSHQRLVVNEGGTRSSKTYSLAQLFVYKMVKAQRPRVLTICRKTLPALRTTAMRDVINIMKEMKVYREENHNKTELIYRHPLGPDESGNMMFAEMEFISVDEPQKIRGRKRDDLWMNEANEFEYEDFRQLVLRTSGQIFMDYNPSDEFHWIYERVLTRPDAVLIKSTYLDNPFLDDTTIKEIERLKEIDPAYWMIYGLGERAMYTNTVYTHWRYCDKMPTEGIDVFYGLDFGYNNPTSLVQVGTKEDEIYSRELLYQSYLTNAALIDKLKSLDLPKSALIYADAEDPKTIQEIRLAGFNIRQADKGKGSVKKGIDLIKTRKLYVTKDSVNLLKEIKAYRWIEKNGFNTDDPVKVNDHAMDALRYAVYTHLGHPAPGIVFFKL